jgi:hypothetical protein
MSNKRRRRSPPQAGPAILKGVQPQDPTKLLAQATPDQLQFLMHSNLALWAQYSGLEVDQRPFDFDKHRYLLPIYLASSPEMAWMKSAQMGATIYEVLRLLWFCRYHQVKAALYFPTADGVTKLAKDRLNPLIQSNAELAENLSDGDALGLKHITNIHGKTSSLYMLYLGGQASKDSVPLDIMGFDEVRLCDTNDIDQALERVSHSTYKYKMYVSTAGYPNQDIHSRFLRGDQQYWHVKCNCALLDTEVVVRRRGGTSPERLSLRSLREDDLWRDYQALSWNSRRSKWQYRDITHFHDNGKREVVSATFSNQQTVVFTPDHRFFTPSNAGYGPTYFGEKCLGDFVHGESVAVAIEIPDAESYANSDLRLRLGLGTTTLQSVEPAGLADVADITVDGNHNYVLADGGFLVHNCLDGFIPSECFPDCIIETNDRKVHLRCPKCKMVIQNAQNGQYIPHNPGADFPSFHVSQFISRFITPKEIWTHYNTALNKKEFYNAKLGKPFVDEENMPITDAVLESCVNTDTRWLYDAHLKDRRNCAMGVDQHGGNVYIAISQYSPSGKKRIVHLEIVDSTNPTYMEGGEQVTPFKRVHQLMKEWDVGMCVIDAMPNYNEAAELARTFKGRVFIAWYGGQEQKDMVLWHDRALLKQGIRRGSHSIKVKWQVSLNRYTSIDYALDEFVKRNVEMPHPDGLVQVARSDEGRWEADNICRTRFWLHLKSIVRQRTWIDESTGRYRMEWAQLGRDPHFVHAWNYCNIALERLKRRAIILM